MSVKSVKLWNQPSKFWRYEANKKDVAMQLFTVAKGNAKQNARLSLISWPSTGLTGHFFNL